MVPPSGPRSCCSVKRMICALYEPASPRFDANTSTARFLTGRCSVSGWFIAASVAARLDSISCMPRAYGRAATARPCARRSFAAATISMALVICCVFLTLLMRRLMSRRVAIALLLELRLERLDRRGQLLLRRLGQVLLLLHGDRDVRVVLVDELEELLLEEADLLDRDV